MSEGSGNRYTHKRHKRLNRKNIQALNLPTICNINARSVYNKLEELHSFISEEEIDVALISETWERENLTLKDVINIENYEVLSNFSQRKNGGSRTAIIANTGKFHVKDITNIDIQVPWGVEATWCLMTPKNVSQDSRIQRIACCSLYFGGKNRKKTLLLDHISDAYHLLSKKYQRGLYFVIAGDVNDLNISPILDLSSNFQQIVKDPTRLDPPAILDPIITTLHTYYQRPECVTPLDADFDKAGVASDHKIVIARPVNIIDNKCNREYRSVKVRPFTESGLKKIEKWFIEQSWEEVYKADSSHEKAKVFQTMLLDALEKFLPEKNRTFASDDKPWITHKLKVLDRRRKRVFHLERKSLKWGKLNETFKAEVKLAKRNFYTKSISDLKFKKTGSMVLGIEENYV